MISPKICHCIHPFFRNYGPVSTPSSSCIGYSVIKDTVSSYCTKYTMCSAVRGPLKIEAQGSSLSQQLPPVIIPLVGPCSSSQHLAHRLSVRLSPSERRSRAPLSDLLLRLVAPWLPFNNCWSARAASAKCATAGPVCGV